jgi:uncharacterized membrane protein
MECFEAPIKSSALKHSLAPFAIFLVWMSLLLESHLWEGWNGGNMDWNMEYGWNVMEF